MAKKEPEQKTHALEVLTIEYVNLDAIKPNEYNPNRQSDHEFQLLCKSITEDGFTQPVVVNRKAMTIVDGEHRWRAAQACGLKEIPIVKVDMTTAQMRVATLRHNRARGEEDVTLAAAVLRDLAKLGAIDHAIDSLMLDSVEVDRLLSDMGESEAVANVLAAHGAGSVDELSSDAQDEIRAEEEWLVESKRAEAVAMALKDSQNISYLFSFTEEEHATVKAALNAMGKDDNYAAAILELCRQEQAA